MIGTSFQEMLGAPTLETGLKLARKLGEHNIASKFRNLFTYPAENIMSFLKSTLNIYRLYFYNTGSINFLHFTSFSNSLWERNAALKICPLTYDIYVSFNMKFMSFQL